MMFATESQLFISSVGWALIHFLWQGTLITLAYWAITKNIQSIHAKYWTGMTMVIVSLMVPIINISTNAETNTTMASESLTPLATTIISHQQLGFDGLFQYMINSSLPYVVMIWAFTVLFLSFRLVRSWIQLAAIKHECEPKTSGRLKKYIKNIAIKLDLPTIPQLKISKDVMVPAAYGLFKPTILLPLSLISQIPKEQLEAIIKHELCHLKRNDFIHNIIQLCADILLFFHPGIKWMNNDIRHIREQCCDQLVLSHDTETLTYAKALTNIAAFSNGIKLKPSVQLGINDGMLLNRVKFLLQNKSSQSSLMVFLPFLMLILFVIFMLQPAKEKPNDNWNHQSKDIKNNDLQPSSNTDIKQKRMTSQSFYPKFNQNNGSNALKTAAAQTKPALFTDDAQRFLNEVPNAVTIQDTYRTTLLNQFKLEMELPTPDASITPVEIFIPKQSLQPSVDSKPVNNPDPLDTINAINNQPNSSSRTDKASALYSFDNTDSIKPKFKRYVAPEYPQYFWYNQVEQDVIATFKIQSNGRAYDISLVSQNNNYVAFEQEVEKAMKRWKFDTTTLNGSTLPRTYQQIFSFAISDEIIKNCETKTTGTRLSKPMPCNK